MPITPISFPTPPSSPSSWHPSYDYTNLCNMKELLNAHYWNAYYGESEPYSLVKDLEALKTEIKNHQSEIETDCKNNPYETSDYECFFTTGNPNCVYDQIDKAIDSINNFTPGHGQLVRDAIAPAYSVVGLIGQIIHRATL